MISMVSMAQSSITFYTGNVEALFAKAKKENKHIFIDTYTSWCKPCKKMNRVFADRSVANYYNNNFINIKVNMDEPMSDDAKYIKYNYQVIFMPTILILDPNGNQRYKVDRVISAEELLKAGDLALHPEKYRQMVARHVPSKPSQTTTTSRVVKRAPIVQKTQSKTTGPTSTPGTMRSPSGATIKAPTTIATTTPIRKSTNPRPKPRIKESKSEEGKIVMTVDNANIKNNPKILREEAYYRLTRMDGTHVQAAHDYLLTQKDWGTKENMQFLMDFTENVNTDEFKYIVKHKGKFVEAFGRNRVDKLLEVAVYRRLHHGLPRASKKEAIRIYKQIGVNKPVAFAYHYYLPSLMEEGKKNEVIKEAKGYFKKYPGDVMLAQRVVKHVSKDPKGYSKKNILYTTKIAERLVKFDNEKLEHKDNLLKLYMITERCKDAIKIAYAMEETDTALDTIRNCKQ